MERRTSHFASFRLDQNEPNDDMDKKFFFDLNTRTKGKRASIDRPRSQPGCNHSRAAITAGGAPRIQVSLPRRESMHANAND